MNRELSPLGYVGYQVRTADGRYLVGVVHSVQPLCLRLDRVPGAEDAFGYLPIAVIASVDRDTNTLYLLEGVSAIEIAAAPRPPEDAGIDWHMSEDWWADLMGHYGLYDPAGRGNEPLLHPDQG